MRIVRLLALLACAALLTGCSSLLDREYSVVEEHSQRYWESEAADTLRAESYQDIVNDLLLLVGRHTETALIRLYEYTDDAAVSDALERAASEVQQETPMGAYAVEYITSETQRQRSYYETTIRISYRRTLEQIQAVVNATSAAALPDLLSAALQSGRTELAVRVGYWGEDDAQSVEDAVALLREEQGLSEEKDGPWAVSYYPSVGKVGLVEFLTDPDTVENLGTPHNFRTQLVSRVGVEAGVEDEPPEGAQVVGQGGAQESVQDGVAAAGAPDSVSAEQKRNTPENLP